MRIATRSPKLGVDRRDSGRTQPVEHTEEKASQVTRQVPQGDGKSGESLASEAYRMIEERIVTLAFPPGSTWSEAAIAEAISIGRTPVREALQRLAAGHVVSIVRGHGIIIAPIDMQMQLLVVETRRELERLIALRATRRILPSDKRKLLQLSGELIETGRTEDVLAFLAKQFIYKELLAEIAGNPFATAALEPLHILTRRFYFRYHRDLEDLPLVTQLHSDLLRSVATGDEAVALQAVNAMTGYAEQLTHRIVERER